MFLLNSGAVLWSSKKQPIVSRAVLWSSKKQPIVSLSATSCACHAVWLKGCWKSCQNQDKSTIIHYDSSSTIKLSKNPVMHCGQDKSTIIHYDSSSTIKLSKNPVMHCGTSDPLADVMTKPLKLDAFLKT